MKRRDQFDEVMIVNPSRDRSQSDQRVRLMRFHNTMPPELSGFGEPYGYYAEPEPYGYYAAPGPYGYYGEVDPALSYYSEVGPGYGYYGEVDPALSYYSQVNPTYGYYGEVDPALSYYGEVDPALSYYGEVDPAYGYYGEVDPALGYLGHVGQAYGYYGQAPEFAGPGIGDGYGYGYGESQPAGGEPVGYFAEEQPMGYYSEDPSQAMGYYGQAPEMAGYGEPEFAEEYPGVSYYGEPDYSGYARQTEGAFNPGCPLPTNVSGFEDEGYGGYSQPATVNPSCEQVTPQPGSTPSAPEAFKPLW
jgi:hypothetical protein